MKRERSAVVTPARIVAVATLSIVATSGAASCGKSKPGPVSVLRATSPAVDLKRARWRPEGAVVAIRRAGDERLELELEPGWRGHLRVEVPGACPVDQAFDTEDRAQVLEVRPRMGVPEWLADVGYDRDVEIAATDGCPTAPGAQAPELSWRVVEGDTPLEVLERGARVRVRTPSLARALEPARAWLADRGVVPISPRTQGALTLEASYRTGASTVRQRVHVAAAARATGIPTIAFGSSVYLFGEGWTAAPVRHGPTPELTAAGGFTRLVAEQPGRFVLAGPSGQRLALRIGRFDQMPLDCCRADCHVEIGRTIGASRMTHVFERGLGGELGDRYDPRCAVACHALGEPGLDDGGFMHLARILSTRLPAGPAPAWFADMPRELRRTSGVGCLACHGPAAIPEPDARWSALRVSVCATCHDAPPRYGHVMFWQSSRMAASDREPATREGECAGCHTTAGFLVRIGARSPGLAVPADAGSLGIACAACHSPHARDAVGPLVRRVKLPASLGARDLGPSAVCVPCHSAVGAEGSAELPRATAAELVLAGGPHDTPRGCLVCHSAPRDPAADVRGTAHSFKAIPASCTAAKCHTPENLDERVDARGRRVKERAAELWGALVTRGAIAPAPATARLAPEAPPHASPRFAVAPRAPAALAEAARRVAIVREDPAAGAHDAARARALLDEAEALMAKPR